MAGTLTESVYAYFTISGSSTDFILDDPVRGVLDGATYVLAGDIATDLAGYMRSVQITRGRERALDEMNVGVAQCEANNYTRQFDPEYTPGSFFGNIKPGKRVTFKTNGITIFDGLIDDWDFQYPLTEASTATFDVADCLATLGSAEFDEWTSTAGQATGARLTSMLDRPEVDFPATRSFDTGTSTLQSDLVSWGSNVLNYAQLVTKCDLGQLFASRDGVLTFYGRDRTLTGVGAPVFRDDGVAGGIGYSGITIDYGTELLFNRVSVDATGFTKQTVNSSTSFDEFQKWWSLSLSGLPLADETQALEIANLLLDQYSAPDSRIASVTVNVHGLEATEQNSVLVLDIGSVVRIINTPDDIGDALDKYCLVEGVDHLIGPMFHQVTLKVTTLVDGFDGPYFILDDPALGVLDSSASVLAY